MTEPDRDLALLDQQLAHRTEQLEAVTENVRILEAIAAVIERSDAPPGTTLGQALVGGYVSLLDVVEAIRSVPDPLAQPGSD